MVRNRKEKCAIPKVESDGEFIRPIPVEGYLDPTKSWYAGLSPWKRLNSHHTYSSVRRNVNFKPFRIMRDHLDLVLTTAYQHDKEVFPDPIDIYFQKLTIGGPQQQLTVTETAKPEKETKRGKRHHRDEKYGYSLQFVEPKSFKEIKKFIISRKLFLDHPLIIGGIKERIHPSSVKLMNSSHHSPQTNAGYVRQDRDGMVFYY